jgi:hypothetical protein
MNSWKLRLILIGAINTMIGVILGVTRGFDALILGYIAVSALVTVAGIVWNPKEKAEST